MSVLERISQLLNETTAGWAWVFFRVAFFFALVGFVLSVFRCRIGTRTYSWLSGAIAVALVSLWIHQARWQLAGFAAPQFVNFLRRYDRRPWAGVARPQRGRVLDVNGVELARDDEGLPGIRRYPLGPAAAHVVGFFDTQFGSSGVERAADALLAGQTMVTPEERRLFLHNLIRPDRARGHDVRLTIDARLQREGYERLGGRRGAIIILDPHSGAIRAIVSAPAFDPESPATALAADPNDAPMLNRAIHGLYPPGSTFKIVTAAIAIEAGLQGVLDCPAAGFVPELGARPIRDHEYYAAQREGLAWKGHGRLDLREAFVRSSNVYFAQLGVRFSPEVMLEAGHRFCIENPLPLFQTAEGRLASSTGRWIAQNAHRAGARAQAAIGQGSLLVTPLHMAVIAAAVANDGLAWQPHLDVRTVPELLGRLMRTETARSIKSLMRDAVHRGTGRRADRPGLDVAGKTGTAQNPRGPDHAWFAGFAPYGRPRLAIVVLIEQGGAGGLAAAPVAADLLAKAAEWGLLEPRDEGGHP